MKTKVCSKCKKEKPLSEFYKDKATRDGLHSWCKVCKDTRQRKWFQKNIEKQRERLRPYHRRWRKEHKEKVRNWKLKYLFGIALEDYNQMLEEQNGVCAICGKPERKKGCSLSVDHNHRTGQVRGLLCGDCNRGLGLLNTDSFGVLNLEMAIKYVKKYI